MNMMASDIPRYAYSTIIAACDPTALIEALAKALISDDIVAPERAHHHFGTGTLLLMPAWRAGQMLAVKVATVTSGNAERGLPAIQGEVLLISAVSGQVLASLDGAAVTQLRTAALAGLAVDRLAARPVDSVLVVGTGALAPHILQAVRAVRPSAQIALWGRNQDKAREIVAGSPLKHLECVPDLKLAARQADVIICATSATEHLVEADDFQLGAVLVLMGGFSPGMCEAAPACFKDALVVIDGPDAMKAGDLLRPIGLGILNPEKVATLDAAILLPRPGGEKRTIFKSVGSARFDFIAAEYLHQALKIARIPHSPAPPE